MNNARTVNSVLLVALLSAVGCQTPANHKTPPSKDQLLATAVLAEQNSSEQVKALWLLYQMGTEVAPPQELALEDSDFGLKYKRLSQVDDLHYVFYGGAYGEFYLTLLCLRTYPYRSPVTVALSQAVITDENAPGIEFDGPPKWTDIYQQWDPE